MILGKSEQSNAAVWCVIQIAIICVFVSFYYSTPWYLSSIMSLNNKLLSLSFLWATIFSWNSPMAPFNFANFSIIFKTVNVTRTNNCYISLTELVYCTNERNNSIWNSKIFSLNFLGNVKSNDTVVRLLGNVWTRTYKNNKW